MSGEVWLSSTDEERWSNYEEYATRADAIKDAPAALGLESGQRFWTGVKKPTSSDGLVTPGMATDFSERLSENVCQDVEPDFCEDWFKLTTADSKRLAVLLSEAVERFISEHPQHRPKWFAVKQVQEHVAPPVEVSA